MNSTSNARFAPRIQRLRPSPIREILKVIDRPGMISFAGGLPNAKSFPQLADRVPEKYLQYGPSEGEPELRQKVCELLSRRGLDCEPDQVLILSGSQQGIDLVAKAFVDTDTGIALEYPTYLAALQVFDLFGASYHSMEAISVDTGLAYAIPSFQNPTGRCYTEAERISLATRCDETSTVLFEDDPYSDLYYENVCRKPVVSYLESSSWIYQGSFSKSFCPGLRLGYMVCSRDLLDPLTRLKQSADLHSNRISQCHILALLSDPGYEGRLETVRSAYQARRNVFDQKLTQHFSGLATWEIPSGGLFFWLQLDKGINFEMDELFKRSVEHGVAFMPGKPFFPGETSDGNHMRLNFSHASDDQVEKGIEILASLVRQAC